MHAPPRRLHRRSDQHAAEADRCFNGESSSHRLESPCRPERAALLARAATAAGVDALFLECHPDPSRAKSDGSTQQSLEQAAEILAQIAVVHAAVAGVRA